MYIYKYIYICIYLHAHSLGLVDRPSIMTM